MLFFGLSLLLFCGCCLLTMANDVWDGLYQAKVHKYLRGNQVAKKCFFSECWGKNTFQLFTHT